jgi:hypothetical protein
MRGGGGTETGGGLTGGFTLTGGGGLTGGGDTGGGGGFGTTESAISCRPEVSSLKTGCTRALSGAGDSARSVSEPSSRALLAAAVLVKPANANKTVHNLRNSPIVLLMAYLPFMST